MTRPWLPEESLPGRAWRTSRPGPAPRMTREQIEARRRAIDAALDEVEARREPSPNP